MSDQSTVNIQQAADIAQVSRRTVHRWVKTGKVQYRRTPGGRVRIIEASILRHAQDSATQCDTDSHS